MSVGNPKIEYAGSYIDVGARQFERYLETGSPFGKPYALRRTKRYYIKKGVRVWVRGAPQFRESLQRIKASEVGKYLRKGVQVFYTQPSKFDGIRPVGNPNSGEFDFERGEILINLALLEDHAQKFPCPYCMEKHLSKVIGYAEEIDMGERDADMEKLAEWARKWRRKMQGAKEHSHSNPVDRGEFVHVPVCAKGRFDPKGFRVIPFGKGIKATIGCPKGHFVAGRCEVATAIQNLMFPEDRFTEASARKWAKEHKVTCRV